MENRDWTTELRVRVNKHLAVAIYGDDDGAKLTVALRRIMADVGVFGVLKTREGYELGLRTGFNPSSAFDEHARREFPLPMRTRQVLREEQVPDADGLYYRWNPDFGSGRFECAEAPGNPIWSPRQIASYESGVLRHAMDLLDNPYRTEQVPADENNPWPEIDP